MLTHPGIRCARAARQQGFTMIELMVVVVIFAIAAALAVPNFATALANYRLRSGAEAILNGLNLARAEAIRRNTTVSFTLNAPASGWTVGQVAPATDIQARPNGESPGVVTASSTPGLSVSFLPNGLVDTTPANRLEQVTVSSAVANTETRRINIFGGGLIRMCDPAAAAANDPRRC